MFGRVTTAVVITMSLGLLAVPLSSARTSASAAAATAPRCTIVGTSHADRLVGTAGRDVICGRGGDDVVLGRGGDDILRGGEGRDSLNGGDGADTVNGGPGRDKLSGGDGSDRLLGGLSGDLASGGSGRDVVSGGEGNDDLAGGPQADHIDGGLGTNWCTLDAADTSEQCVYDLAPPSADTLSFSKDAIDVTWGARQVTVRFHLADDTGVEWVNVTPGPDADWFPGANAVLRSGTVRDGWWEATLDFQRWSLPGTYTPQLDVWDRVNRHSRVDFPDVSLEVRDDTPDLGLPSVTLLSPTPAASYDVRNNAVSIKVRARITDELSGATNVGVGGWAPRVDGVRTFGTGGGMQLISGDRHDGIWTGWVTIMEDSVGGDWSLTIEATDRAHRDSRHIVQYWGPGEYVYLAHDPVANRPFPNNMGSVTVIGRARTDTTAPTLQSIQVTPDQVDTLPGPASVHVTVQGSDAGRGVGGVNVGLFSAVYDESAPQYLSESLDLTGGDLNNGTWSGWIDLPQGIPPGTYYVKVLIWDRDNNMNAYMSSGHPDAAFYTELPSNPTVTVVDSSP